MSTLAISLEFISLFAEFIDSVPNLSVPVKTLFWYGLSPKIPLGYNSAIHLYMLFYATRDAKAWPALEPILIKWVTKRVFGSAAPKQTQIKPKIVKSYLLAIKSYQVDHNLDTKVFFSLHVN